MMLYPLNKGCPYYMKAGQNIVSIIRGEILTLGILREFLKIVGNNVLEMKYKMIIM